MKTPILLPRAPMLALAAVLLTGCSTRSISNSAYDESRQNYYRYGAAVGAYRGELSELDVVGVTSDTPIAEADIRAALTGQPGPRLDRNSRTLLIQSGAEFPDAAMVARLGQRLHVQPFSGVPSTKPGDGPAYARSLRLAAARGGFDKIVCYWGVLESEQTDQVTKVVSWVPLAGSLVPDQRQSMRLRLKAVVVDVASGRWTAVSPASAASEALNSRVTRRNADQNLVGELKATSYEFLAQALTDPRPG